MAAGMKVFILTGSGQATGMSPSARVCFTGEEEAPRAGLGSGGASTQRGAGGGESLTPGPATLFVSLGLWWSCRCPCLSVQNLPFFYRRKKMKKEKKEVKPPKQFERAVG